AKNLTSQVLAYARRNNITQIIVGRSRPSFLDHWLARSFSPALVSEATGFSVMVVTPETSGTPIPPRSILPDIGQLWSGALAAIVAVAGGVLAGKMLEQITRLPNLSMVF